ncbi:DUF3007 family protein [Acaryochloris sp. 'Moss Beach']|uniref:DUF3007 family protein n=1 Tax=Acaryochloris TaxID=155977 RepID=UPI001BB058CD|nr:MULTISPECIES: DUF3007 family protein [Acaryochloris]QUY41277.1 DUF3007 family protein [Acaryochloris marina S15]UJB70446.1 DUF3007 family protein [Acaryochloris sp. 'Moss Beach']
MRRIDAIAIGIGVFLAGGLIYGGLRYAGIEPQSAGVWSQVVFAAGLLGWVASYFLRVVTGNMTYNQQREDYEDAMLEKRLKEMTPEELEALQASIDDETDS